jgi:probable rRNA maturation factor
MLHLQGYDHQTGAQARCMEALEVEILDTLGYTNPYND